MLTKTYTESAPHRYDIYTHFRFLKTAVKTHTPLFAGPSAGLAQDAGVSDSEGRGPREDAPPQPRPGCTPLWYACPSPAFSAPPGYPVLAVNSSPRSNKYPTGEHFGSDPRAERLGSRPGGLGTVPRSTGHPAGATCSFRVTLP